ncbi:protein NEDD1, partial [Tanacetum coccineum]
FFGLWRMRDGDEKNDEVNYESLQMIASVGLDKKLYTFDSGSRRRSFCISYEAPFSSVAFREDGNTLAAGTTTGQVNYTALTGGTVDDSVVMPDPLPSAITSITSVDLFARTQLSFLFVTMLTDVDSVVLDRHF